MSSEQQWSPAVATAVVGGVATIVCAIVQFVVAPLVVANRTSKEVVQASALPGFQQMPSDSSAIFNLDQKLVTKLGSERLLAREIASLTCWQLRVLRNIPPARHGHQFTDPGLASLFKAQPWYRYQGRETPTSDLEDANIALLQSTERQKGCLK
jgi:hypothetical protein